MDTVSTTARRTTVSFRPRRYGHRHARPHQTVSTHRSCPRPSHCLAAYEAGCTGCLTKYDNAASPGLQSPPSTRHPEDERRFTALGGRAGLHLATRPQRRSISAFLRAMANYSCSSSPASSKRRAGFGTRMNRTNLQRACHRLRPC